MVTSDRPGVCWCVFDGVFVCILECRKQAGTGRRTRGVFWCVFCVSFVCICKIAGTHQHTDRGTRSPACVYVLAFWGWRVTVLRRGVVQRGALRLAVCDSYTSFGPSPWSPASQRPKSPHIARRRLWTPKSG